ncbi:hypothetical protein ABMA27_012906 [Loxostege sticticalis]|uniref:Uncharacterized protein n=1 Tax=Loxostege sticticalis TaxID=481309 RepID=A0ABR3H0A4_LOXSC
MAPISRVYVLFAVAVILVDCCYSATIPRNFDPRLSDEMVMTPKKRPFCNAFTDSENAIEELSRQILSEAKLWEAIQEASAEIARRKQKEINYNQ